MIRKPTRLRSMTGYAVATAQQDEFRLTVSLRSVNHRYLDLRLHLPEFLLPLESKVRNLLQNKSPRGHLDLKVVMEAENGSPLSVDEALIGKYMETFQRVAAQYGLPPQMEVATLAQLPGVVMRGEAAFGAEITPELEAAVLQTVQTVVERWDAMRGEEAAVLVGDLGGRIRTIGSAVEQMERWRQEALRKAQGKMTERLQGLLGQAGLDPTRLAQEALLLADRTDTSEEILRLKAHVAQFAELLTGDGDAGRKLDFLLQEINREANTLLSKVAGLGESSLPVTQLGLEMKAEIEKLREQVQNLQ